MDGKMTITANGGTITIVCDMKVGLFDRYRLIDAVISSLHCYDPLARPILMDMITKGGFARMTGTKSVETRIDKSKFKGESK